MKNALDTEFPGLRSDPLPIQAFPLHNLSNIAEPDQPSPDMFRRMEGKHQQQVFWRRRLYLPSSNWHGYRALKQPIHVKIDCTEARLQRPLQLQQVFSRSAIEGIFASGSDIILFGVFRHRNTRLGA